MRKFEEHHVVIAMLAFSLALWALVSLTGCVPDAQFGSFNLSERKCQYPGACYDS